GVGRRVGGGGGGGGGGGPGGVPPAAAGAGAARPTPQAVTGGVGLPPEQRRAGDGHGIRAAPPRVPPADRGAPRRRVHHGLPGAGSLRPVRRPDRGGEPGGPPVPP